jgi:hypothetical protein
LALCRDERLGTYDKAMVLRPECLAVRLFVICFWLAALSAMMPAKKFQFNNHFTIRARPESKLSGDYFCDVNKYANGEKDARIIYDATNATRATQAEFPTA